MVKLLLLLYNLPVKLVCRHTFLARLKADERRAYTAGKLISEWNIFKPAASGGRDLILKLLWFIFFFTKKVFLDVVAVPAVVF
jgi:hypothetical protein